VIFEKENINSADTTGELLLTILSSLAQDESRNISENTKWGIRSKFQKGIPHLSTNDFMGFDKDNTGRLVVNKKEAELVRGIYKEFLEGSTCSAIAARLNEEGVPGVSGKPKWISPTIEKIIFLSSAILCECVIKWVFVICAVSFCAQLFPHNCVYLREECICIFPRMVNMRDIQFVCQWHHLTIDHTSSDDECFFVRRHFSDQFIDRIDGFCSLESLAGYIG
jgi:hypothetical protein